jgi:hypothetical protein
MADQLAAMARRLLAENYRDGVRAIEFFALGIIVTSPDADLARCMTHIAKSNASVGDVRTKMNRSLLRKLQLAVRGKYARRYMRAA